jgi:hypothetical protein
LAVAWGLIIHSQGWGQLASYAQVRAFADGQVPIDRWHWETKDKAWIDGHFYSVKAPGLAALTLPVYKFAVALGGQDVANTVAKRALASDRPRWKSDVAAPYAEHGFSATRADRIELEVARGAPMVWALSLFGALVPAIVLLFLVRWIGDRFQPGYGTIAAITLGLGTIVMTFASEFFPHVISATLGFAAFAVLFRERQGPPKLALVGAAGLLAGLAVTFEYPLALVGAILFFYALARAVPRLPRAATYAAGAVAGAIPALAFNAWAFGNPLKFAYGDAVKVQGLSGHAELGLNDGGVFGVRVPDPWEGLGLLLQGRGLLVLTPVIAMGVAGVLLLRKGEFKTEAKVILAVIGAYWLYDAGYWLPFGGGTPGPRFLIPMLPFLALGFALAWKRWPAITLALAIPSALYMTAGALTHPLIGESGTGTWVDRLARGELEHTLLTGLGVKQGWVATAPVVLATVAAIALTAMATPRERLGSIRAAVWLVLGWAVVAVLGPVLMNDPVTPLNRDGVDTLILVAAAVIGAIATLLILRRRERRDQPVGEALVARSPALSEGIS